MKRVVSFVVVLFLVAVASLQCQPQGNAKAFEPKTRILILNPTAWYLENFVTLVDKEVIDIPGLELTAVFFSQGEDRFTECEKYVKANKPGFVLLRRVECELNKDDLFRMNSCTDHFRDIFRKSDGALFLGGADLPPYVYAQKTNLLTGIYTPKRHFFELSALHHLVGGREDGTTTPYLEEKPNYVVYGFCLGMQTMNVAAGGSMHQDIPSELYGARFVEDVLAMDVNQVHSGYWKKLRPNESFFPKNFHQIQIARDGYIEKNLNVDSTTHPKVCSYHHQAVKDLAGGYMVAATSMDGKVVESISHKKYKNVFGVQFHPEFAALFDPSGPKYKYAPTDTAMVSENEILAKDTSLAFHRTFWAYFSGLFE